MTASADRGLRPQRAAEIIVALPDGARRGSGYLLAPGRVLTAAHVVRGARDVRVRFEADRPGERVVGATVAWAHDGIDVAVLTLPENAAGPTLPENAASPTLPENAAVPTRPDRLPDDLPPVRFGGVGEQDAVLGCSAMGFPRFKLRADAAGGRFRDVEHMDARCAVLANRREGTLDLRVAAPPAEDPDPERDAWEGMSGAAVFSGGHVVGVVSRHHRREGAGRVAAGRVDRWAQALTPAERTALEALLGQDLTALPCAVPRGALGLVQEAYRAQLADLAPQRLEEREAELADLVSFCGGPDPYLWVQGPPWAGKTALAAWFALHPPRGVVPVWFFVTARDASQSDSDAYTVAVIDQLATLAGREPAATGSPTARDGERRLLLRQAAERVAQDGGTLLLVVDGLDEDQSASPGGSGASIASLLPERLPPNVRVLVTSRTYPGLPADVKGGHPLRGCRVLELAATEAARHTEHEAKFDLHRALSGDRVQRDLVGLLTAARGTLTADDLRELTGEPAFELRRRLESGFGRILRLRGDAGGGGSGPEGYGDDLSLYTSTRGYLFAHETLLTTAQDELGPDLITYLDRLHAWARSYERRGWPAGTPLYLLQPYGRLLAFLRDADRATALAVDVRRRDRLREATGSDGACLGEIAAARETVRRAAPDDLAALAALAAAGGLVAQRNVGLHPGIPAVYARLGQVRHAIGLARTVRAPVDRARALTGVAHVLAEAGDRRAVGLATEAVGLTGRGTPQSVAARTALACALASAGRGEEVLPLVRELPWPKEGEDTERVTEALVRIAAALRDPAHVADVLELAEQVAAEAHPLPTRVRALTAVAEACSLSGRADEAARLFASVTALALRHAMAPGNLPAVAAEALREARPREAALMTSLATAWLESHEEPRDVETLRGVVRGLLLTDRVAEAGRLLNTAPDSSRRLKPREWGEFRQLLAMGWARAGQVTRALRAAADNHWDRDRLAGPITELLLKAGAADHLEDLLVHRAASLDWPLTELAPTALVTLAAHFVAEDRERSRRLLHEAEHGDLASALSDTWDHDERVVVFAGALAAAGRPDDAERLVETVDEILGPSGYAAMAEALVHDPGRARHFAERAYHLAFDTPGPRFNHVQMSALQALACAGATQRVLDVLENPPSDRAVLHANSLDRLRVLLVEGLWPHAPDLAARWVDELLAELPGEPALTAARLVAAAGRHDPDHARRIGRLVRFRIADLDARQRTDLRHDGVLTLLTAADDPDGARHRLDLLAPRYDARTEQLPGTAVVLSLAHAALGDFEAARDMAARPRDEVERAEARTQLAAYVAGVQGPVTVHPFLGEIGDSFTFLRRLAVRLLPPPGGPDLPRARALLADALTPDGWYMAAQVLAEIDPDALLRAKDVAFAHLGLAAESEPGPRGAALP
ncbi:trypsin-like peptidase domain-containing protein [Streptomyces sp. NPDC006251]|uniref:trypsin-like peptidase domain-containing protein n=1 Tax=Streptomyces sp. NPDC006251 TaxID=3155718 RepID=UPI0033B301A2